MKLSSINNTTSSHYSPKRFNNKNIKPLNTPKHFITFHGKFSGNSGNESTLKEILEIVGVSVIPMLILIYINNFFKSNDNEHIFLNDGTYFEHTDKFQS